MVTFDYVNTDFKPAIINYCCLSGKREGRIKRLSISDRFSAYERNEYRLIATYPEMSGQKSE